MASTSSRAAFFFHDGRVEAAGEVVDRDLQVALVVVHLEHHEDEPVVGHVERRRAGGDDGRRVASKVVVRVVAEGRRGEDRSARAVLYAGRES